MERQLNLDIPRLLGDLATRRPIFHSEADLQHEIAWYIRQSHPDLKWDTPIGCLVQTVGYANGRSCRLLGEKEGDAEP
jgi:hypothetical protein